MNNDTETKDLRTLYPLEVARGEVKRFITDDFAFLKDTADSLIVNSDEEMVTAGDFRKQVNTFIKKVEEKRKEIVEPMNGVVKSVNAEFKMVSVMFEGILTDLDTKIKPWLLEVAKAKEHVAELKRAEELKAMEERKQMLAEAEFESGNKTLLDMSKAIEFEQKVLAETEIVVKKSARGNESTTSIVKRWYYTITDETKVPRVFLSVDDAKIKSVMKKESLEKGEIKIEGVEFYFEHDLSSR